MHTPATESCHVAPFASFPFSSTYLLLNLQFCNCHLCKEEIFCLPLQNCILLFFTFLHSNLQGHNNGLTFPVVPSSYLFSQLPLFNVTAGLQHSSCEKGGSLYLAISLSALISPSNSCCIRPRVEMSNPCPTPQPLLYT